MMNNAGNSPMHMGMAGPAPGVNPFTVDEIQELMGLIPGEQQSAHHAASETHQRENSLDSSQPLNAVAVSSTTSSGLAQVLGGGAPHGRMGSPAAAPSAVPQTKEIDEGSKSQARSERKRSREKQRRTDVNKQFGELTEVLKRIEAEEQQLQQERAAREEARDGTVKQNGASRMILPPFSPTNRVDLIARTIAHLERLSHVTKKQLAELQSLEDQLKAAKKSGEDMAQKLKEVVFNQQQQGGMMMGNMMGGFNPMQMAMGGANPMAMATGAPNAMSVQPQKPQMMMMVPMMIPPGGTTANAAPGAAAMMPQGNQPFMMMPQAFMPSQQAAPAPAPVSTNAPAGAPNSGPAPVGNPAPAPANSQQMQQNQQAMMMQQQAMMMQSMQPMMQQMQMMQQQPQQQPVMQQAPAPQPAPQQAPAPTTQQQPQMIYPAPQQAPAPTPIMAAPPAAQASSAGMAAAAQRQIQAPQQQQAAPQQQTSPAGSSASQAPTDGANGQGGSYAYAA